MSDVKEYIVTTKTQEDAQAIGIELTSSLGSATVPSRTVDVVNERPLSKRNTHYALTAEEALELSKDPRVIAVEIPPELRDDIKIGFRGEQEIVPDSTSSSGNQLDNWAFIRCTQEANRSSNAPFYQTFNYNLAGAGCDVVITDSGVDANHPEWQSPTTKQSRLQQINWYAASGITGTQPTGFYQDQNGHGTHVTGTVAGKRYGWAKEANIYSLKIGGLEGAGDTAPSPYGPTTFCDILIGFHNNKPVDPNTGYKRPTIVNMSWGYTSTYVNSMYGQFQGVAWDDSTNPTTYRLEYGMLNASTNFFEFFHPVRIAAVDADIADAAAAGIIFVGAAGNDYHLGDVPSGINYDNWYSGDYWSGAPRYYHRGSSPCASESGVIVVGAMENITTDAGTQTWVDQKTTFSSTGPNVTIYAPGRYIQSAYPSWASGAEDYPEDPTYKCEKLSGTSMASPQVCGLLATILGMRPWYTRQDCIDWMYKFCVDNNLSGAVPTTPSFVNYRSVQSGTQKIVRTPFVNSTASTINLTDFTNIPDIKHR